MRHLAIVLAVVVGEPAGIGADASGPEVRQLVDRTVAEAGRTRVIAFEIASPADADLVVATDVEDPDVLDVVGEAIVGAGETIGFVRVLGGHPGWTSLHIGSSAIAVEVVEPVDAGREPPRIIGPVGDAAVWGTVAVGVEVQSRPRSTPPEIVLQLPDGTRLDPFVDSGGVGRPDRQVVFKLDLRAHEPGPLTLVPVAIDDTGGSREGPPVTVQVIHPDPRDVVSGEAETRYDVERPERFSDERVHVGKDPTASRGAYFVNNGAYPAVCFPLRVEAPGWYQIMLTAAGTRAQGALPTVGIVVDGGPQSTTNGRLLHHRWHRFAAGVPIHLDAGEHVLTPFFANDFYVAMKADRNLFVDRIEIARLPATATEPGDAGDGAAMAAAAMDMAMDMGPGSAGGVAQIVDDPYGRSAVPVRVAFMRPLDGQVIPGTLEIEGRCAWTGMGDGAAAPVVSLVINGETVHTQRSGAPRFWVDPSFFVAGANEIALVARLDSGSVARTPVQTMHRPPAAAASEDRLPRRALRRFTIHDERWGTGIREHLRTEHNPKERRAAALFANGSLELDLPPELAGTFDVFVHVRGDHFEGPPIARVSVRHGENQQPIGNVEPPKWWDTRRAGTTELEAGRKQLIIAFENDRYEKDKGDRNLWLQAVIVVEKPIEPDRTPPVVEIEYPPQGHTAHGADALVVWASDNASLASAGLIVDGQQTPINAQVNLRPGRGVVPLALRTLSPGEHTLAMTVTDVTGNSATSAPVTIVVTDGPPAEPGPYDRAVRLLDRFGYGPNADELAAILTMGETAWLHDRLARSADDAGDLAALAATFPVFVGRNNYEVPRRVLMHLLLTPNPVRARFVLWSQNHFSTWIRKVQGPRKWDEHVAFHRMGPATFDRLVLTSARSPAMLQYLDQERSFAGRLNENYAREIMELHTLGVDGGYAQADVTSLARLLTGWTASFEGDGRGGGQPAQRYHFRFDPRLNDGDAIRLLGYPFSEAAPRDRYDRVVAALELLAAHPATARFVSRKLAEHYVSAPPPPQLVDDLAEVFLETNGDMAALLVAIAEHPAFWDGAAAERIAPPLDYGVRLFRAARHEQPWQLADFLQRSGFGVFDRASPDGYPQEDAAYTDSNAMIQRWRLPAQVVWPLAGLVPGALRYRNEMPEDVWRQLVVDVVAIRLTGRVLADESNRAALDLLATSSGNRDERVRLVAPFIARLPEANLR